MGSLFRKLIPRRGAPPAVGLHVAAFGKHPGWDDHIEDLGLDTHRLVATKRVVYTQGIAGNIDSGAWEKLGDQERLEGFHHLFLWHTGHDLTVGRMWSSSDGKGRTRFPMVVCAQVTGLPIEWTFRHVLPLFETVEARCLKTASAAAVRAILRDASQILQQAASGQEAAEAAVPPLPRALAYFADRPEMAPNHQGVHRILYVIEREMAAYHVADGESSVSSTALLRAGHLRVPACVGTIEAAAALWLGFLLSQLDPAAPILLMVPVDQPWVDIVVGEPGPQQFFCVRASLQAVPLTTDIPYTLDAAFVARAEGAIGESREERVPLPDLILQAAARQRPMPAAPEAAAPPRDAAPQGVPAQAVPMPASEPPPPAQAPPPRAEPVVAAPPPHATAVGYRPVAATPPVPQAETLAPRVPPPITDSGVSARPVPRPPVARAIREMDTVVTPELAPPPRRRQDRAWAEPSALEPGIGRRMLRLWPLYLLLIVLAVLALLFLPLIFRAGGPAPKKPEETGPFTWLPQEHGKAWQALCEAYRGWFPAFHRKLTKERLSEWRRDAGLARLIVMRAEKVEGRSVDPRDIAGVAGGDYTDLGLNPPSAAKTREGSETTRQALEIVKGVEESIARWASYDELSLKPLAAAFAPRGWTRQAAELEAAADTVKPGPNLAEAIDAAVRVKLQAAAIELKVRRIAQHEQTVQLLGDDAAARVHDLFLADTRGADTLDALQAKVDAVEAKTSAIAASGKALADIEASLRSAGDAEAAKAFVAAVRAAAGRVSTLDDISAALSTLKPAAQGVDDALRGIRTHCAELRGIGDKALADKLWGIVRTQALSAAKLDGLAQRLARARADVARAAERRKGLQQQHDALKALGNGFPARLQQRLDAAIAPATTLDGLLKALDDAKALADGIASRWTELRTLAKVMEASGDRVLATFPAYLAAKTAAEPDPASLPDALDRLKAEAAAVAAVLQGDWKEGKIDRALFAKDSGLHRSFAGTMGDDTLARWRKEAADYYKADKDDPRQPKAWGAALEDFRLRMDFLKEEPEAAKRQLAEKCRQRSEQLDADIAKALPLPWIRKHEAAIAQHVATIAAGIEALRGDLKDAVEHPRKWLERIASAAPLTSSKAINDEWAKRRDALVPRASTPEAIERDRKGYMKLWRDVEAVRTFLTQLDDPQQLPPDMPPAAKALPAKAIQDAAARELAAQRERAVQAIVAGVPWTDAKLPGLSAADFKQRDAWLKPAKEYATWREGAGALLVACHEIVTLLDAGYHPDDKPDAAPRTPRELHDAWQKRDVPKELLPHFGPTIERLQKLLAIKALDRKQLAQRAATLGKGDPPQAVMIVWRQLGATKDWPADLAELNQELALRELLAQTAEKLKAANPHAVRWVPDELARQAAPRWEKCFSAVTSRAAPKDLSDPDVAAVVKLAEKFGDPAEFVKRLGSDAQFRWKLHHFRRMAAGLRGDEPKEKLDAAVADFLKDVQALGDAARQPNVARLLGDLKEFAEQKMSKDPKVGLDKAGPACGQLADKWKAEIGEEGKSVTYTWDEKGHRLAFLRIEPKDPASKACYLSATEMPVGLFLDAVRAADKWADMGILLDKPSGSGGARIDMRKGPRTWEWMRQRDEMAVARTWLVAEAGASELYPKGIDPGRPTAQHPVQYVSAPAAMEFAWLLGCRLPAPAEWQAALAASDQGAAAKANLRDATWRKQQDFMREKAKTVRPEWPDAAIYPPPDADLGTAVRRGGDASTATDADDQTLWFSPVGAPPGAIGHLVGNVAELVLDPAAGFEDTVLKAGGKPSAESFRDFAQKHEAALGVIGASALSPPELWDGKAKPFERAWPFRLLKERAGRDSFADVGFRLAFTAPSETPADRLRRTLRRSGYPAADGRP